MTIPSISYINGGNDSWWQPLIFTVSPNPNKLLALQVWVLLFVSLVTELRQQGCKLSALVYYDMPL